MESATTVLIGVGVLLIGLFLVLGVAELALLRTIRPPQQKTFAHIRLAENQYQTIFVPALGALIAGLFVSISASFFFESFSKNVDDGRQIAGVVTFLAGAAVLAIMLSAVVKGVGEPKELARDPFTIRAAAEEFTTDPRRSALPPSFLTQRVNEWAKLLSTRALNITAEKTSPRLEKVLEHTREQSGFWHCVAASWRIYLAALARFPFRFCWPLISFVMLSTGAIWYAIAGAELDFFSSWRPWLAVGVFVFPSAVVVLFYCAARGNRARLWYRVYVEALTHARHAIRDAHDADAAVKQADAVRQSVIDRADAFLQSQAPAEPGFSLTLGRFRLSLTQRPRASSRGSAVGKRQTKARQS